MLEAAAEDTFWLDAWAILDDMLLMGIKPNTMSFNNLLHVCPSILPKRELPFIFAIVGCPP
jgi:pentatricopeptide repeat protein